jgi:hypothetical protein
MRLRARRLAPKFYPADPTLQTPPAPGAQREVAARAWLGRRRHLVQLHGAVVLEVLPFKLQIVQGDFCLALGGCRETLENTQIEESSLLLPPPTAEAAHALGNQRPLAPMNSDIAMLMAPAAAPAIPASSTCSANVFKPARRLELHVPSFTAARLQVRRRRSPRAGSCCRR